MSTHFFFHVAVIVNCGPLFLEFFEFLNFNIGLLSVERLKNNIDFYGILLDALSTRFLSLSLVNLIAPFCSVDI